MSAEERDNKIIDALKKNTFLRFTDLSKKTGLNDQTLTAGLRALEKTGEIVHRKRLYALSENKDKLREKYKSQSEEIFESLTSYQLRRDHTEELKQVICQWIEDFPTVTIYGIDTNKPNEPLSRPLNTLPFQNKSELLVENEFLFNDLLFHMEKQEKEIVDLWKRFKEICLELV